jgi:hypothetical protein
VKSQETIVVIPELVAKRCLGGTARPVSLSGDMRLSSCGTAMWQKLRCCGAAVLRNRWAPWLLLGAGVLLGAAVLRVPAEARRWSVLVPSCPPSRGGPVGSQI